MTAAEEAVMLSRGLSAVTVLKVAHHGAKSSTSHALLAALKPQYAVISAGAGNKYGHPHAETIERLKQAGVNLLRTDKQGAIVFTTDGASLSVEPYR
ncbi:MAG: hypothetical protein N2491_07255 [Negativicutes bacterium]|nr:hypothetical protein [Negativicutes bacterium]